jgi:hypothetical protein
MEMCVHGQVGTVGNKSPLFGIRKVLLRKGVDIDIFEAVCACACDNARCAQVAVVCKDEHTYRWYHVCVVNRDAAPRFEHLASLP